MTAHCDVREDTKMLQLIELYKKRAYLCDKVAACNWTIAAYATLSCDLVAHSHNKIARENCRCDIGFRTPRSKRLYEHN